MNIIQYLKKNNYEGLTDHNDISSNFNLMGITVSYENEINNNGERRAKRRYIFTNARRNRKLDMNDMCSEANGLILEAPDWKPLVISTLTPKSNVDKPLTNSLLKAKKYDIFKIEDGTIINLYYYDLSARWVISTSRGIEVNECVFNKLNYTEILNECLTKMNIIPEEFFGSLDKATNYTIGFKHPDMHPFQEGTRQPIYKLWFVQMATIDEETKQVTTNSCSPWHNIPNHTKVKFNVHSMSILFSKLKNAYDSFADNGIVDYGFLLVAKNPDDFVEHMNYSVILLESSLMNLIRRLWYDLGHKQMQKNTSYLRLNTILLNSFLADEKMESFSILFPQYRPEMDSMIKVETQMVESIFSNLNEKNNEPEPSAKHDPEPGAITNVIYNDFASKLTCATIEQAKALAVTETSLVEKTVKPTCEQTNQTIIDILCSQVTNILTVGVHEQPKQKIRDIIHNSINIEYYYKTIYKN